HATGLCGRLATRILRALTARPGSASIIPTTHRWALEDDTMSHDEIVDQIFARIGCFGIAGWLVKLAGAISLDRNDIMPIPAVRSHSVSVRQCGLELTLHHPHAGYVEEGDPSRWALSSARFDTKGGTGGGWPGTLLCGLDKDTSTPRMARLRLGES